MKSTENAKLLAAVCAAVLSAVFFSLCLANPSLHSAITSAGNINLIVYAGTVLLFCFSFFVLYGIFRSLDLNFLNRRAVSVSFSVLFFLGSLAFLASSFLLEDRLTGGVSYKYLWHNLPFGLVALLCVSLCLFFFGTWRFREISISTWCFPVFYGTLTLLMLYTFYTPNIFGRALASDTAHGHAYFNSVYNVYHGCGYSEYTTGIYGHYGLFYKLPWKLFNGSFQGFVLITALLGALCFLCSFLTLHLITEHSLIRILGCIAMTLPILSMRGGYYWQVWPHRILFASVLLLFGAVCLKYRRMNRSAMLIGYLLSMAALIWNTESGVICAIAWASLWLLRYLASKSPRPGGFLVRAILHLTAVAVCFFGAYGLVSLYNLLQDTPANSLAEFLFPLMSASYMTDLLHLDLPLYPAAYMAVMLLFFGAVAGGISVMRIFRHRSSDSASWRALFAFFLGVLSLGQLTYFINRPAYHNLDICHLSSILCLAMAASQGITLLQHRKLSDLGQLSCSGLFRSSLSVLSLSILLILSVGTLTQYSYNHDIRKNFHNMEEFQAFADTIAAEIPPHTYGFGVSVAELYSMLGWSTNCFTLDFTDLSVRPRTADYVIADIQEKGITEVFTGQATTEKMRSFAPEAADWFETHFALVREYEFCGSTFRYYRRRS